MFDANSNRQDNGYTLGVNKFADRTLEELRISPVQARSAIKNGKDVNVDFGTDKCLPKGIVESAMGYCSDQGNNEDNDDKKGKFDDDV